MWKVHKATPYSEGNFLEIEKSIGQSFLEAARKMTPSASDDELKAYAGEIHEMLNHARLLWETSKALLPERIPTVRELQESRRNKIDVIINKISDLILLLETDGHLISWHDSYDRMIDELYLSLSFAKTSQKEKGAPSKKKITTQKGRTPDVYRMDFILDLAEIFEKITGEKAGTPAYNGHSGTYTCKNTFLDFAVSCVKPIEIIQRDTLASAIKKAFNVNKINPRNKIQLKIKAGEPNLNQHFPE